MNEVELKEKNVLLFAQANDVQIITADDYNEAVDFLQKIKHSQKKVVNYFSKMKKKAYDTWKEICANENDLLNPLGDAEKVIKSKMGVYDAEQEKKRQEEERRLQAEADKKARKEEERLRKRADKLKTPELKEEALEQAEATVAPIVHVEKEVPQRKGIVYKTTWKARLSDKTAFLAAAASDQNIAAFVTIDMAKLNRLASATKGELSYPGIEFYSEKNISARG